MKRAAFTLIELIVVIAIIAVLAAIVAPTAFQTIEKSKISRAAADIKTIKTAAMGFYTDTGTWPLLGVGDDRRSTGKGFLDNDNGTGFPVTGWDGPYLEKWPNNPWGKPGSFFGNKYYWDADFGGDDNFDGIVGEAQVIMFNVPRKSGIRMDNLYDDGAFYDASNSTPLGNIYQNRVVNNTITDPTTVNWMIMEPTF